METQDIESIENTGGPSGGGGGETAKSTVWVCRYSSIHVHTLQYYTSCTCTCNCILYCTYSMYTVCVCVFETLCCTLQTWGQLQCNVIYYYIYITSKITITITNTS